MKRAKKALIFLLCLVLVLTLLMVGYDLIQRRRMMAALEQQALTGDELPTETYAAVENAAEESGSYTQDGEFIAGYTLRVPEDYAESAVNERKTVYEKGDAFLSLEIIPHREAAALKPAYLDDFIDYTDITFMGVDALPGTVYQAQRIYAGNGNSVCQAWLIDADRGAVCLVIGCDADDTDAWGELNAIAATLEIQQ
jgi:hypothetical protein